MKRWRQFQRWQELRRWRCRSWLYKRWWRHSRWRGWYWRYLRGPWIERGRRPSPPGTKVMASGAPGRATGRRDPPSFEEQQGARFAFTDIGNSRRFTADHMGKLIYVHGLGWLLWTGRLWKPIDENRVLAYAKKTVAGIAKEVGQIRDHDARIACLKWQRRSQARERLKAMVELAAAGEARGADLRVEIHQLNADKSILNTPSGVVDLKTGKRRESDPEQYCTRITRAAYDENADMTAWLKVVKKLFPDEEMRTAIKRFCGVGASGEIGKAFGVLWGETDTAKTTFVEIIALALGDYAGTVSAGTLTTSYSDTAGYDLATLHGCRFARFAETTKGRGLANERIKEWTGGAPIKARQIRGKPFEFTPEFTLVLTTNFRPVIPASDSAMWNRLWSWELTHVIPKEKQDRLFADKMVKKHGPAILKWLMEGAVEFYREGLLKPAAMADQLSEWRASDDAIGRWVGDCLVYARGTKVRFPDAFRSFRTWAEEHNEQEALRMKAQDFHGELEMRSGEFGFEKSEKKSMGYHYWRNMRIKPPVYVAERSA
jgi:P4 family phage/plasmid primase-like protien